MRYDGAPYFFSPQFLYIYISKGDYFGFFIPAINSKKKSFVRKIARIFGEKLLNKKILAGC